MRYLSFTVSNYKAVVGPLFVDLSKKSLIPIIGTNECGKTTILHAIYGFDYLNDGFDERVRHLQDTTNLYSVKSPDATVTAGVECTTAEFKDIVVDLQKSLTDESDKKALNTYKSKRFLEKIANKLEIERNLVTRAYKFVSDGFIGSSVEAKIAQEIVRHLPWTLYYDDFRDSVDDKIEIKSKHKGDDQEGWLAVVDRLFKETNDKYSVDDLPKLEDRQRKTLLDEVNLTLNNTLSRVWQDFKLEDREAFEVKIDYLKETTVAKEPLEQGIVRHYISFDVVEKDPQGRRKYFKVRDRSKGFFWFFNFVMKLEFNPKVIKDSEGVEAIYLLDEPGSYLHAAVQARLCLKLEELSHRNKVIFCTHSHHLINPDVIPLTAIKIAKKNTEFKITLDAISDVDDGIDPKSAFQPIYDALQLRPFSLDLNNKKTVIVEGIYDYYSFDMFNKNRDIAFLPARNADSIKYFISLLVGWHHKLCALWDNDDERRTRRKEAIETFGTDMQDSLRVLTSTDNKQNIRLEDLYDKDEFKQLKTSLGIPAISSFEKTVAALKFSKDSKKLVTKMKETSKNFRTNIQNLVFF